MPELPAARESQDTQCQSTQQQIWPREEMELHIVHQSNLLSGKRVKRNQDYKTGMIL